MKIIDANAPEPADKLTNYEQLEDGAIINPGDWIDDINEWADQTTSAADKVGDEFHCVWRKRE
jgi:hypothetical protein